MKGTGKQAHCLDTGLFQSAAEILQGSGFITIGQSRPAGHDAVASGDGIHQKAVAVRGMYLPGSYVIRQRTMNPVPVHPCVKSGHVRQGTRTAGAVSSQSSIDVEHCFTPHITLYQPYWPDGTSTKFPRAAGYQVSWFIGVSGSTLRPGGREARQAGWEGRS